MQLCKPGRQASRQDEIARPKKDRADRRTGTNRVEFVDVAGDVRLTPALAAKGGGRHQNGRPYRKTPAGAPAGDYNHRSSTIGSL